MERFTLDQFGPATRFDAAHIVNDETNALLGIVAEPENRALARSGEYGSHVPGWDEDAFREAVRARITDDWDAGTYIIQFDPGRDRAEEETVTVSERL